MFDAFDDDLIGDSDDEFLLSASVQENISSKRASNNQEIEANANKRVCMEVSDDVKQNSLCKDKQGKSQSNAKRKFAGPAGLLPNLALEDLSRSSETGAGSLNEDKETPERGFGLISNMPLLESQLNSDSGFDGETWLKYKKDMSRTSENYIKILEKFNVSWILKKVKRNINFHTRKIPFLSVILISVTNNEADSHNVIFRDSSGKIEGSIHYRVMEKYRYKLHPGSVLVLHQFSVFSPSPRKHYLCITENNVVRIYYMNEEGSVDCEEVKSLSWFELAKDAEQSLKEISKEKHLKEQNGASTSSGNNKSFDLNSAKTYPFTPENYKRKEIHSPYVQNSPLVRQESSNIQLGNSSNKLSSPVIQTSSVPKKFTFKKITQDAHAITEKLTNKCDSNNVVHVPLALDNEFIDDIWNDDDFESLVQDIRI